MKTWTAVVFLGLALNVGAATVGFAAPLFENGVTEWRVRRPARPDCVIDYAVQELTNALKKVSGADFAVVTGDAPQANEIFVGVDPDLPASEDELVVNRLRGGALWLAGNESRAALHAVYSFLQRELGVRWVWPGEDGEFMPQKTSYAVPAGLDWQFTPSIRYRGFHRCGGTYKYKEFYTWAARNFICIWRHGFKSDEMKRLGFYNMVLSEAASLGSHRDLFEQHPEYFCYVGSHRSTANVCFSSAEAVEIAANDLVGTVDSYVASGYPLDILSLLLADNQEYCKCEKCAKMSVSEGWFRLYNAIIARLKPRYPGLKFATLAYQGYRDVPTNAVPDAAFVEYATHGRCHVHEFGSPSDVCESSAKDYARMVDWERLGVPMAQYAYEYDAMGGVFLPFYTQINETIDQAVAHRHVLVMPEVGLSPNNGPDSVVGSIRNRLSEYFYALKMWDASLTPEAWLADMTKTAFGPAAESVAAYLREMNAAWSDSPKHISLNGNALLDVPKILTPARRSTAEAALAAAAASLDEAEAGGENVARFRSALTRENTLFAQWTRYVDKAAGRYTTVYAPRLREAAGIGDERASAYGLQDTSGVAGTAKVRFAWAGDAPGRGGTTASRLVVEFLGVDETSRRTALEVELSSPDTDGSYFFRIGRENVKTASHVSSDGVELPYDPEWTFEVRKGVCRLIIPVTTFNPVPLVGGTWSVRSRCVWDDRPTAFPSDGALPADLVFFNHDAADRPLFYYYGDSRTPYDATSEKQSALDNGFRMTVATNVSELSLMDPATRTFFIRETSNPGKLSPSFSESLTNAVAAGGVAVFISYWNLGLEGLFNDPSFACSVGSCASGNTLTTRVPTYILDDRYIRSPNDLYSSYKNGITPAYVQQPKDETPWTVCLRQAGKLGGVERNDYVYLAYRPYGKGYVVIAGEGIRGNTYSLMENFHAMISEVLDREKAERLKPIEVGPEDDLHALIADVRADWLEDGLARTFVLRGGTYALDAGFVLDWPCTLRGQTGDPKDVVIDGRDGRLRGVTLTHAGAGLVGVTVTRCAGLTSNGTRGGGVYMTAGTVENCHITANSLKQYNSGGAGIWMSGGQVLNSVIDNNLSNAGGGANHSGAGIYMEGGWVEGCLITGNVAARPEQNYNSTLAMTETCGGGVYMTGSAPSWLVSCTVWGNYARCNGGGVYAGGSDPHVVNCLIAGNSCDWATSAYSADCGPNAVTNVADHCLIGGDATDHAAPFGLWAGLSDPSGGDFSLGVHSDAFGGGNASFAFERDTDLAGNPRVRDGQVDIGCLTHVDAAPCGIGCDRRVAVAGTAIALRATRGETPAVWTVTAPDGSSVELTGATPALTLTQTGTYSVRLDAAGRTAVRDDFLCLPRTNYVAQGAVAAAWPYDTPATATVDLKEAVAAATDGSTIVVTGTVAAFDVRLDHDIAVVGGGPTEAVVDGQAKSRVFDLNSPNARVEGLKITNGRFGTALYYVGGAGARIGFRGGTIARCRVEGNQLTAGTYYQCAGGVLMMGAEARVTHSVIAGNMSLRNPGGGMLVYDGLVDNCLVCGNVASSGGQGGGIHFSTARGRAVNCTIVANRSASGSGGGVSFGVRPTPGQLVNCLIAENVADDQTFALGKPDWSMASTAAADCAAASNAFVCCAFETCAPIGVGSVAVVAPFRDAATGDWHVLGASKSVDAGRVMAEISATDLDGLPRVSGPAPDIGCYEVDQSVFAPTFDMDISELRSGESVSLAADLRGAPAGADLRCRWTLTNGGGTVLEAEGVTVDVTIPKGGRYRVRLDVFDGERPLASFENRNELLVTVPTCYVTADLAAARPVEPFDTPETASTNLNEVIERYVSDGCRIVLDAGTHALRRTIELTRAVRIVGDSPENTFVVCTSSFDSNSRTFLLNHADSALENLTFCGVRRRGGGNDVWGPIGCIGTHGGTVSRCVISNNTVSALYANGVAVAVMSEQGRLTHCLIADNSCEIRHNPGSSGSVSVTKGLVDNCLVCGNRVDGPAGIVADGSARVYNCTVTGNVSTNVDTALSGNTTGPVSAANGISLGRNCDAARCRVVNCVFAGNAGKDGPFSPEYGSSASEAVSKAVVRNCLFAFDDSGVSVGTQCVNAAPRFVSADSGDFRLLAESPARKTGCVEDWMREDALFATDLDGRPRFSRSRCMDMGCYAASRSGLLLLVR